MSFCNKKQLPRFVEKRKNQRSRSPITIVIGNTPYAIENWSFSGMKIANYYGVLQPPDKTKLKIFVPTAGPGALFQTTAETKRYNASEVSLSVEFQSLDISAKETLNRYFQEQAIYNTMT